MICPSQKARWRDSEPQSFAAGWLTEAPLSTANMFTSFEHSFELTPEARSQVLAKIEADRGAGRLRPFEASRVSDEQALERFAVACSALTQAAPQLKGDGSARRGVARAHLEALQKHLLGLRAAIEGVQTAIGDETYDLMPPGAMAALSNCEQEGAAPPFSNGISSFADFLPDPLRWQSIAAKLWVASEWVADAAPRVEQAIQGFDPPGKSRGSAARIAGRWVLLFLRLLDRADGGPVRRPRRKHLADWLKLLFEVTGETPPKNIEVLAKNVLADGFSADPTQWEHPEPPWGQAPRNILTCTVLNDGVARWSGALVDRYGQRGRGK
jgi:hypothetical protein